MHRTTRVCRSVRQRGVTVEYFIEGSGPAIVILPSLGRGPADYDVVSRLLVKAGFSVLRPQPRGLGGSRGEMDNVTLHDLADDIATMIEAEALGATVIAGHAFGNFVARQLAEDHPHCVRGVALLAASAGKTDNGEEPVAAHILHSVRQSGNLSLTAEERMEHLRRAFFAPGNDCRSWLEGWYPHLEQSQYRALKTTPVDDYFAAGVAPILDLQAEHDAVAPRHLASILRSALGDRVEVVVIPNAGHALVPEQPEAVSRHLAEWARARYAD